MLLISCRGVKFRILIYYINTNEILGEPSRENMMIPSQAKMISSGITQKIAPFVVNIRWFGILLAISNKLKITSPPCEFVPSPDETGGGLGLGLANPRHNKVSCYRNKTNSSFRTGDR